MNAVGRNIKKIRELKSYTQSHLAKKLGMSQSNYARIENGHVQIDSEKLKHIASILEINTTAIVNFDKLVYESLKSPDSFTPDPKIVVLFFTELRKLYEEEIELLKKRIKLMEMLSNH